MRLIDADAIDLEEVSCFGWINDVPTSYMQGFIDGQSTVDAGPVVHAHWEDFNADDPKWLRNDGKTVFQKCSRCHTPYVRNFLNDARYCPNCGAKMDGEAQDD